MHIPHHDEIMTSSAQQPEIQNLVRCHQRRTERRPQSTVAQNVVKFRRVVVFEICDQPEIETDTHTL